MKLRTLLLSGVVIFLIGLLSWVVIKKDFFSSNDVSSIYFAPEDKYLSLDEAIFTYPDLFLELENSGLEDVVFRTNVHYITDQVDVNGLVQKNMGSYEFFDTEERVLISGLKIGGLEENVWNFDIYMHQELQGVAKTYELNAAYLVGLLTISEYSKQLREATYEADYVHPHEKTLEILNELTGDTDNFFITFD